MNLAVPRLFPHAKTDWVELWFVGSIVSTVGMILKEFPISDRSGGRESFHWAYDLTLFLATVSALIASNRMQNRFLAKFGYLAVIAGFSYLLRPTF